MTILTVVATMLPLAAIATAFATAPSPSEPNFSDLRARQVSEDTYTVFLRKRNAHACMMSIVFIVLFPLGAISLHLPLQGLTRRVITRIHAPIQVLGVAMMIGAMGLGIDIARNDLLFFSQGPVHAHVVLGLVVTSAVVLLQPALGLASHLYYRRKGEKSKLAVVHRWCGRILIPLGWINSGLGFQLVGLDFVPTSALVRGFVIMGLLGGIWFLLVGADACRARWLKKEKLAAFGVGWDKGVVLRKGMRGGESGDVVGKDREGGESRE